MGAQLRQYILKTHNQKTLKIQWEGFEPHNTPSAYATAGRRPGRWQQIVEIVNRNAWVWIQVWKRDRGCA